MKNIILIRNIFKDIKIAKMRNVVTKQKELQSPDEATLVAVFGTFRVYQVSNARNKISDFQPDLFLKSLHLSIETLLE